MASVSKREWIGPDGTTKSAWEVRWRAGGRHRSRGGFRLKRDADAFARSIDVESATGLLPAASRTMTVGALVEAYLRMLEDRLSDGRTRDTRYYNFKIVCARSVLPHLGRFKISELTSDHLEAWYAKLVRKDKLAPATAKARAQDLKLIFDFAVRKRLLTASPVPALLTELRNVRAKPIRVMTLDQVRAVLAAADARGKWAHERTFRLMQCLVHVAAFCGLRQGEILGLRRQHVRFDLGVIEVRHSLDRYRKLKEPKTASGVRDVPMPPHVSALIQQWLTAHFIDNEQDLIFTSPSGLPMCGCSVSQALWHPILERAGLLKDTDNFHFHSLRHFASSWWIHNGLPITDTASLMGHSKFDTTLQIYAHAIVGGTRSKDVFERMATGLLASPQTATATSFAP